ncbi:MAG TPA: hypothetical protein VFA41_06515 [Ktedonobacteraceae bacterium]|jgi:methyl-accepting chemotaxis protein|nr:hypothetical protein [Ktedonobacteraceae bacterium]
MKKAIRFAGIAGGVIVVLLIVGFVLAAIFGVLLNVLYIALIILAAFSLLSTLLLIYTLMQLIGTITTVRNEMKPLIGSVQETVTAVRGSVQETLGAVKDTAKSAGETASTIGSTAKLTKDLAVAPSVRAVALLVGAQQAFKVFLGKGHARKREEERRKEQLELLDSAVGGE